MTPGKPGQRLQPLPCRRQGRSLVWSRCLPISICDVCLKFNEATVCTYEVWLSRSFWFSSWVSRSFSFNSSTVSCSFSPNSSCVSCFLFVAVLKYNSLPDFLVFLLSLFANLLKEFMLFTTSHAATAAATRGVIAPAAVAMRTLKSIFKGNTEETGMYSIVDSGLSTLKNHTSLPFHKHTSSSCSPVDALLLSGTPQARGRDSQQAVRQQSRDWAPAPTRTQIPSPTRRLMASTHLFNCLSSHHTVGPNTI